MIRFLVIISILSFHIVGFSQHKTSKLIPSINQDLHIEQSKANGDTIMFFDGRNFSLMNVADQADFIYQNSDFDSLNPQNPGYPTAFELSAYTTDNTQFLPGDTDTAWFTFATSWFSPTGQADNWFTFGPISIPSEGADLSWYVKHHPQWSDSYQLFISDTGYQAYVDIIPGQNVKLYSANQIVPPAIQPANDTIWTNYSVTLDAFAGQRIYLGFQHNADDGDVLYLDHFLITEADRVGINEEIKNPVTLYQNYPNPANEFTVFTYQVDRDADMKFQIMNILGETVFINNDLKRQIGTHSFKVNCANFPSGLYFYSIEIDGQRQTKKMIIK